MKRSGMKTCALAWTVAVLIPAVASAQLKLELSLKHTEVLQYEDVAATLVLHNNSAQPFVVARDATAMPELKFTFERKGLAEVGMIREGSILKNLYIIPRTKDQMAISVNRWYNLASVGQYLMRAVVSWQGKEYESNPVVFDVVTGLEMANLTKPVTGHPDRERKYSLRYWRREREEHLFLSVLEEKQGYNYGVFPLGPLVRVHKPTITVDNAGDVKIRHQSSATCYIHTELKSLPNEVRYVGRTFHLENGNAYPVVDRSE